jgi:hypothetical protein
VVLPPATLKESWRPAARGKPERFKVRAEQVDLAALAALAVQMPLTPQQRQLLAELAPRGRLLDAEAEWRGRFPAWPLPRARPGRRTGHAAAGGPGQACRAAGLFQPERQHRRQRRGRQRERRGAPLALDMPAWFAEPDLAFDQFGVRARWSWPQADQLLVEVDNLNFSQGA